MEVSVWGEEARTAITLREQPVRYAIHKSAIDLLFCSQS